MDNIGTAVQLMIVGMATVFVILLIVIYLGKLLINLVNKYAPEEVTAKKPALQKVPATVDALTRSIIEQAVKAVTGGKGKVTEISKRS